MCGDRVCLDKNEFKEYFAKNLIFEVKAKPIKKKNKKKLKNKGLKLKE